MFQGVFPPARFCRVFDRIRYVPVIAPVEKKRTALAPPEGCQAGEGVRGLFDSIG